MGPESGPRNTSACSSTAAVSRGDSLPHRLTRAPVHSCAAYSLTSISSRAPTNASPCSGYSRCNRASNSLHFSCPQSLDCILRRRPAHNQRSAGQHSQRCSPSLALRMGQSQAPVRRIARVYIAQFHHHPAQPQGLGLVETRTRIESALHVAIARQPHNPPHPRHPEEHLVPPNIFGRTHGHQVHQQVRSKSANLPHQPNQLIHPARSHGITHVAMHQPGLAQHRRRCRGLGVNRKIGQQEPLGLRKRPCNQVETRQGYNRVSQAAQPVDQDPLNRRLERQAVSPTGNFAPLC